MAKKIAFVGVGRMGANMARRLKECGHKITAVYDSYRPIADELAKELDCAAPAKLAEVTDSADIIITVVTDDASMEDIFGGADHLLKGKAKGKVFINCATISPKVHVAVQKKCQKVGADSLEACMASSIPQARAGTLYLMVGGEKKTFNKVKAVLTQLSDEGKLLRYIGVAGQAAQLKALVNMVMNINTAGLAEGLGLADALGLDLGMVMEVFSQTGANSRVLVTDGDDMRNRDHDCYFSADHAAKDSGIALELAKGKKVDVPLATATFGQFSKMRKLKLGHLDKSGVAELTFKGRGGKGLKK
ncbi:MAG: NAD(P)-dependent oxidoreductase [Verrucomicrobiae bacterium]|jgi:3-hydroxyisobutyrate dehydrogenase|nr:NAD(P)-dependent oxidoreductase [Verrucomicrobiae bacterium]